MMKRTILLAALLTAGITLLTAQSPEAPTAPEGRLVLKERTVELGDISPDSVATARFTVYNAGTAPAAITRIFSSCSCAVASYSREPIAPGDSTQFDVRFDPRDLRPGQFRRTLTLRATGAARHTPLFISGSIKRKYMK